MTLAEYIKTQRQFDKLFDKFCRTGSFSKLTEAERQEYFRLQQALVDYDNARAFDELIASGDYRIGC